MPEIERSVIQLEGLHEAVTSGLNFPTVFKSPSDSWLQSSLWSPGSLASVAGDIRTDFRVWPMSSGSIWENDCPSKEASFAQFNAWVERETTGNKPKLPRSNPFYRFPYKDVCLYAGYKEMSNLFGPGSPVHDAIDWGCAGLAGRGGSKTVFWMGTAGAYTPCHYDSYGYNIVAQLHGHKRWTLYAPDDSKNLYPTRIPYEESSVFSDVDHKSPDLKQHPAFAKASKHEVTLEPGEVLYVPKHWWHLVESLDTSISVNTWVEMDSDKIDRVGEAIARTLVTSVKSHSSSPRDNWLNPNEVLESYGDNLALLKFAVSRCHSPTGTEVGSRGVCDEQVEAESTEIGPPEGSLDVASRQSPQTSVLLEPAAKRPCADTDLVLSPDAPSSAVQLEHADGAVPLDDAAESLEKKLLNAILFPDTLRWITARLLDRCRN